MALKTMGRDGMTYLAAAVSDFFIPEKDMATHKIQVVFYVNLRKLL